MHGNACTRHPRDNVRPSDGRCRYCLREASARYYRSMRESHRLVKALEQQGVSLSVSNAPKVML